MRRQAGAPLFYFYKERLGTKSPPHPTRLRRPTYGLWWLRLDLTEQSPGLFDPQGEGFGGGKAPSRLQTHPSQPAQLGGGPLRALVHGPQARQKKERPPAGSPPTRKGGSREEEPLPPWCSFLRLSSKESRAPRRSRRGPRGAAPQGGFGATYPKGTYPPFPGEEPLISPGAAAGYPLPGTPGRGTPPGAGRPPGPSTAGGCPRGLSWRRSPCASRR